MTNEQEDRLAAMEGEYGDEQQFQAVQNRTEELINQSFDLFRIISGGSHTSVLKGNNHLISYAP
jgi:hypothetical protein